MPEHLVAQWPCLRLVSEQLVSWTELETVLSIDDVDMLREAYDLMTKPD